jgi:hypothetical protein
LANNQFKRGKGSPAGQIFYRRKSAITGHSRVLASVGAAHGAQHFDRETSWRIEPQGFPQTS